MTVAEALDALRSGDLHLDVDALVSADPDAARALTALISHLGAVIAEVRRIAREISVEGRLGGHIELRRLDGIWSELVVDVNHMSHRVTDQVRDLHQTLAAQERSEDRVATAPAAGEIQALMDAVNAIRARSPQEAPIAELAEDVSQAAGRVQANFDTLASRAEERADEVRRLLDERTQFFAALSHELRTPIAVILRQAELLAAESSNPAVEVIRAAGQDLLSTVDEVLDLAKAERCSFDLALEDVDLGEVVEELRPTATTLASAAGVTFDVAIARSSHLVRGDARRLRQLVRNLIDNAIKYTPAGGAVAVEVRSGAAVVNVSVRDTGPGFPMEDRRRIFEPFSRASGGAPAHDRPSSGLGLALAKGIVDAHGGAIWAIPSPRGSLFMFELPRAQAPTA